MGMAQDRGGYIIGRCITQLKDYLETLRYLFNKHYMHPGVLQSIFKRYTNALGGNLVTWIS